MHKLRERLTYANVAATLALVIAVAGGTTAIAANKAPKNSVASSSIKPFNVTARDLAGIRVVQVNEPVQGSCNMRQVSKAHRRRRRGSGVRQYRRVTA